MSDFDSRMRRYSEDIVWGLFRLTWGLTARGLESVPKSGPLIFAFNHASLLDGPLVGAALRSSRRPVFLAKRELFSAPLIGEFLRNMGTIALDRGSADHGALRAALEMLRGGGSIAVSPEGTRVRPGERRQPKTEFPSWRPSREPACYR